MNANRFSRPVPMVPRLVVLVATALIASCTTAPVKPEGAANARERLSRLQADPELATRAPLAIKEADTAVSAAEMPQSDPDQGAYLVFMADRKVELAKTLAESRLAVDQRTVLSEQRESMRLRQRTIEADSANVRADAAQENASDQKRLANAATQRADKSDADADAQRQSADASRIRADAAQDASATDRANAEELRNQISGMQAKSTERGIVLTLGDVLFSFDTSTLNAGGSDHLAKLASFLSKYADRTAQIEGFTDSVGSPRYNQDLSQRRAEAVKSYLVAQGISADRLTAAGKGMSEPVADNNSDSGRQQNRRVEVVINNQIALAH